ncbi:calmodulin-dependent protein kinase [Aureococcus anophagefferens]|uniref:Calmodulin-dependent protein kinase n=1 Tax=Aureococcus anophagefferens TaxID=44056 RepID=A0ABR1FRF2_AURAN
MSARFHRFADFAPDDVEWWQGEAGLLESYVGEWLPAVVRVRQGRVRVEAPVTGAESAVRVLRDFRIGGACAARADGWRLFGGGFAAAVVAADAAAHLRFPAAAARDAFVAAVSSCAATARVGSGYRFGAVLGRGAQGVVRLVAGEDGARRAGKALPFRTSKEKRVACREFELMRRVGRECATAHVVRLLEAFECDAGGAGVVHLDVKPANLLYASLARGAPLKIVDFGLAASVEDTGDEPRPWVLRGTPGYMAPELVTDGAATPKCDVFALGVVAHALLTGREPFCLDRKATAREIFACTAQCRVAYDNEDWVGISTAAKLFVAETLERNPKHRPDVRREEIESIRRLFRAVSGDGGEHLSIVDFGRVMAALDMPFTPDVLFPIYDRRARGTVSAEDFALRDGRAPGHGRTSAPSPRRSSRAAPEATDGVDRETFIDGAIRRCPLLFGVFFLSVSYKMERLFERDAAPRGGPSDSFGPDSGVLE